MSGELPSNPNEQSNSQTEQWQSLQSAPMSDEMKKLIQDGVYGLDQKPTEEYLQSEAGQKAVAAEEKFAQDVEKIDRYLVNLDEQVKAGVFSEEEAQKYRERYLAKEKAALDKAINQVDGYRQDYVDSQVVGTPEEEEKYQKWLQSHDAENMSNLEARGAIYRTVGDETDSNTGSEADTDDNAEPNAETNANNDAESNTESNTEGTDEQRNKANAADEIEKQSIAETEKQATAETEQQATAEAEALSEEENEKLSDDELEKLKENLAEAEKRLREEEQEKVTAERLEELKEELGDLRAKLAELAARNRRLFVGSKNRAEYNEIKREFNAKLDEYLRMADRVEYSKEFRENNRRLQDKFDAVKEDIEAGVAEFAGGDIKDSDKTPEEIEAERQRLIKIAEKMLDQEYDELKKGLRTKVNVAHLERYIEQDGLLREATNKSIDEGSVWRKAISKILTNKYLKGALIGAAVAGLAVTGVGLAAGIAAGTTTVGIGLSAGTAFGAIKGGLSGILMSRQSSKNSALNVEDRATREENIREQLKDMDFVADNGDAENVTKWMLEQYDSAIQADRVSNRKRTAISAGIGAAAGAIIGSLQFNTAPSSTPDNISNTTTNTTETVPTTETKVIGYDVSNNLSNVDVPEGGGAYYTFTQMGGDPANLDRAVEIMYQIDSSYGLSPGSNGEVAGFNGLVGEYAHTYPGNISGWPDVAQGYIREVAEAWAREGLISADPITIDIPGTSPIFSAPTVVAAEVVPDAFSPLLNTATEWIPATVGAIPGAFATRQNRPNPVEAPEPTSTTQEETPAETPNETPAPAQPENSTPAPKEQQPEPEPETTPDQTPAEPEQNPAEQSGETNSQALRELISNNLSDKISAEDINMLLIPNNISDDAAAADRDLRTLEQWWGNLDDNKKDAIRQFYQDESDNGLLNGSLFKTYLMSNESEQEAAPEATPETTPEATQ